MDSVSNRNTNTLPLSFILSTQNKDFNYQGGALKETSQDILNQINQQQNNNVLRLNQNKVDDEQFVNNSNNQNEMNFKNNSDNGSDSQNLQALQQFQNIQQQDKNCTQKNSQAIHQDNSEIKRTSHVCMYEEIEQAYQEMKEQLGKSVRKRSRSQIMNMANQNKNMLIQTQM
ncbi:hypothetical protein PPERSA_03808 [Pseudocohnilembus persalinus]|uniref:Uncharacterized protein n=1 Tax=Pseudocohnilembus persalinus TaxID=266149 RepID=A0A0V0QU99_PSEPJ|nr:hypothetical protein PPERSA_03808 [Pseudocohnilembus persalinus]|eukprot:KRX05871.1 hypothetical protein PPERSA_03808 [Pseudocohnilembus persalinus]